MIQEPKQQQNEQPGQAAPLEPLPWEVGEGFLWGFPATVWMIIFHPITSFSRPPGVHPAFKKAPFYMAFIFFCFIIIFVGVGLYLEKYFLNLSNLSSIIYGDISINFEGPLNNQIASLVNNIYRCFTNVTVNIIFISFLFYLTLKLISEKKDSFSDILQVIFYSQAVNLFELIPPFFNVINILKYLFIILYETLLIVIGLKYFLSLRWKTSILATIIARIFVGIFLGYLSYLVKHIY